ncbi:hypothetical protein DOTSEDRAFT_67456 [Dothistroma septosporum NZE10]|uniref:Uncharacterized protein n=1 Tax=Dothistroma septosporum (strain NZE10 / CBS 128990) TaxID=675120 RepID=N1PY02_DOTSN|nr:hypothetical protein DOTSEDRAFT_67456 [Dothistroma septosporum NZE10]
MVFRRFLPFFLAAGIATILVFTILQGKDVGIPWQIIGLGDSRGPTEEQIKSGKNILPDLRVGNKQEYADFMGNNGNGSGRDWKTFQEPNVENERFYPIGKTKPKGEKYTKGLIMPKMKREDTTWVEEELGDMVDEGVLKSYIYAVDDPSAELRVSKNKGHEVMVYLSYIIDNYESLPDVSIFMHAHRFAWHNNELLNTDAAAMVRALSPERVTREGYMNLRCHWDPGCPAWLHPGSTQKNRDKQEEVILADSWSQLFPLDPIPTVLAQPCCAQFAVSRERILETNKMRYIYMRDWVTRTQLSDYLSGRVFEYIWQFIFSKTAIHCPSMSACYCDGYGICFPSAEAFDEWFKLKYEKGKVQEELRIWKGKAENIETLHKSDSKGRIMEEAALEVPEVGMDRELEGLIEKMENEMERRLREAKERGRDPEMRAKASGRKWRKGDGY